MAALPPTLESWNKTIKKQFLEDKPEKAILTFLHMQRHGHYADNFTYPVLLKAAANLSLKEVGLALHGQAIKSGFWSHSFVQTALLNMYSNLGCHGESRRVFEQISAKDIVSWNSMLDAYASAGEMGNAETIFDSMPYKDLLSWNIIVSGYAKIGNLEQAESFFNKTPKRDTISWNSILLACCNAGEMNKARLFFKKMPSRNTITWNTMLNGYLGNVCFDQAIALFDQMKAQDCIQPDYLTINTVLSACANSGSLEKGREVHIFALEKGLLSSPHVTTSLIEMYAKCGNIMNSLEVFFKSINKDIFCWNAMISGLSVHGYASSAIKLFDDMNLKPDDITFIGLLSACSHGGLVQKGLEILSSMERKFGLNPKSEHYGCVVDLLSRAGYLPEALRLVESMAFEPGKSTLGSLLGACVKYRDGEVGERVVEMLLERDEGLSDGEYMMLANLFASCRKYEEAKRWIEMMNDSGITKTAGCSAVEIDGNMHRFVAGDVSKKVRGGISCLHYPVLF